MVEEIATVVSVEQTGVWLTTTPVASCNACQVSDDCGTGIVAKTLTPKKLHFFVASELKLLAGEQVKIGISEQSLIIAAMMVYLLPLLLMLAFILPANAAGLNEGMQMLLAALGAASGFAIARLYGRYQEKRTDIHIVEVLPSLGVQQHNLS